MDPEINNSNIQTNNIPVQNALPIVPTDNKSGIKKHINPKILIIIFVILILGIGIFFAAIFLTENKTPAENSENKNPQEIYPTPANTTNSWLAEVIYNPVDASYKVEKISLQDEEFVLTDSNENSPYTLSILDGDGKVISTMKVSIATNLVIPDIIKNSSAAAGLENSPISTHIKIPNLPDGKQLKIEADGQTIIHVSFPSDIQAMASPMVSGPASNITDIPINILQASENTSPNGWKISVTPICENGKVFAKYSYDIPQYTGVIFTYEQTNPIESLDYLDDSSWQKPVGSIMLISGKGEYIAKGNLANWDPSQGQLRYNGPVGLQKNKPYKGYLMLSGDWTCNGDTSRGGCVEGPSPDTDYIEKSRVWVAFNTSIQCSDVPSQTPTVTGQKQPGGVQCVPDINCTSGQKRLQICPLICQ